MLLFNLAVAANRFADALRRVLRPTDSLSSGRFSAIDVIGSLSNMWPKEYFPNDYNDPREPSLTTG